MDATQEDSLLEEVSDIKHTLGIVDVRVESLSDDLRQLRENELHQWQQIENHSKLLTEQATKLAAHGEVLGISKKVGLIIVGAIVTGFFGLLGYLIEQAIGG
jgi:hypothetical protein